MVRFSWLVILLLASAASAQLEEIKSQTVRFGDMALQYAVVEVVQPNGNRYNRPCENCTANVTIWDRNRVVVSNASMSETKRGLFGYTISPGSFEVGKVYFMRVYIASPTYGSGYSDSYFNVIGMGTGSDLTPLSPSEIPSTGGGVIDSFLQPVADILKGLLKYIGDTIQSFIDRLGLGPAFDWLKGVFGMILDALKWIWSNVFVKLSRTLALFLREPSKTVNTIILPWFVGIVLGVLGVFFFGVMCIELVMVGYSIIGSDDVFAVLSRLFDLHVAAFRLIMGLVMRVWDVMLTIFVDIPMKLLGQINPIGKVVP